MGVLASPSGFFFGIWTTHIYARDAWLGYASPTEIPKGFFRLHAAEYLERAKAMGMS